ncbi:uncharacterized protein LOC119371357 [Jatropha curcas]|uniref:uncharacterized protein LOC119371357 n=1 Tax=Jatropha curcas TaxID=180498 RepID=UPI00189305AD|nr:uncharacterized protein LOC119371357 [Jatropha curcas]
MHSEALDEVGIHIVYHASAENVQLESDILLGNFYRIQSAFKYGARKLGMILSLSNEKMINELNKFFASTLDRHGSNDWTHVQNSCLVSSATNSDNLSSSSLSDTSSEDKLLLRSTVGCSNDQPSGRSHNASQLNFSRPCGENTKFESEISDEKAQPNFVTNGEISCILRSESKENHFVINNSACSCMKHDVESPSSSLLPTLAHNNSENLTSTLGEIAFVSISENSQSFKSLLNLSGDYKSHLRGVLFGLYCHSYDVCAPILLSPPMLPQSENKKLWRTVSQSLQLKENAYSTKRKGVLGQQRFPLKPSTSCSSAFNFEEKQQHRGTGTYIPNMGYHSNRTEKNRTTRINGKFCGHTDDNGLAATSQETESSKYGHVLSEAEYPYLGNGKPMPIEVRLSQPSVWGSSNASGFSQPSKESDSDCQGIHQQEGSLLENNSPQYSDTSCTCDSTSSLVVLVADATESVLENDQERVALQSYHLKDEVDFPPLSYRKALKTC